MISVTADSNIYISALTKDGPPRQLQNLAHQGRIRLDISAEIIAEFTGVLKRKFAWTEQECAFVCEQILSVAKLVAPHERLDVVTFSRLARIAEYE